MKPQGQMQLGYSLQFEHQDVITKPPEQSRIYRN